MTTTVFLTAGGTGGHVFPAEALASTLLKRGVSVHLITDSRGKAFGDALPEVVVHRVAAATLAGGMRARIGAIFSLIQGAHQATRLVRQWKPACIVGFGGYPSFPAAAAAIATGRPLILHDSNAVLGRANRLVAPFARVIATSFAEVLGVPAKATRVLTGSPIRPAIAALRSAAFVAPQADETIHLLITGGSQGAKVFSSVVPQAIAELDPALRARLCISQQARADDLEGAKAIYAGLGMAEQVTLQPFFSDMPERIAACHLFIGRAGGSTVAELTAAGRPAIYVPLPIAILDEQTHNARAVEKAGGGWLMPQSEFTPTKLAQQLKRILTDPASLTAAAAAAHAQGRTDAAEKLADLVMAQL